MSLGFGTFIASIATALVGIALLVIAAVVTSQALHTMAAVMVVIAIFGVLVSRMLTTESRNRQRTGRYPERNSRPKP
jgi:uncharacterized membrane protein YqjE